MEGRKVPTRLLSRLHISLSFDFLKTFLPHLHAFITDFFHNFSLKIHHIFQSTYRLTSSFSNQFSERIDHFEFKDVLIFC